MTPRFCKQCNIEKPLTEEYFELSSINKTTRKIYLRKVCRECRKENSRSRRKTVAKRTANTGRVKEIAGIMVRYCVSCSCFKPINADNFGIRKIENGSVYYRSKCKDCDREYGRVHQKEWRANNKPKINSIRQKRTREDPAFKLRRAVSSAVLVMIKENGGSKRRLSILNYLPYSIEELRRHIENQFESWMNWDNHGKYDPKSWDDNDSKTWKWQLDHLAPQANLPYDSMDHPNFKKCWALENLRPLNAKQNIVNGSKMSHRRFKQVMGNNKA